MAKIVALHEIVNLVKTNHCLHTLFLLQASPAVKQEICSTFEC